MTDGTSDQDYGLGLSEDGSIQQRRWSVSPLNELRQSKGEYLTLVRNYVIQPMLLRKVKKIGRRTSGPPQGQNGSVNDLALH
jgi:hypothetical protein